MQRKLEVIAQEEPAPKTKYQKLDSKKRKLTANGVPATLKAQKRLAQQRCEEHYSTKICQRMNKQSEESVNKASKEALKETQQRSEQ